MTLQDFSPPRLLHANQFTSKWDHRHTARLTELWARPDLNSVQIAGILAAEFNHPWLCHTIEYRAHQLGLPKKAPPTPWTAELESALRERWQRGDSASNIARSLRQDFGISFSRNAIIGKAHRIGLDGRAKPVTFGRPACTDPEVLAERARRKREHARLYQITYRQRGISERAEHLNEISDNLIPVEQRKTVLELTQHTCRWPVGDPGVDLFFCGAAKVGDGPYCEQHHQRAFKPYTRSAWARDFTLRSSVGLR